MKSKNTQTTNNNEIIDNFYSRIIKSVDKNPPYGLIDFEEFCDLSAFMDTMRKTFDAVDLNKDGKVSSFFSPSKKSDPTDYSFQLNEKELGAALIDTGYNFDSRRIAEIMQAIDLNHSNDIQFEGK